MDGLRPWSLLQTLVVDTGRSMLSGLNSTIYPFDLHRSTLLNTFWVVDDEGAYTALENQYASSNTLKSTYLKLGPVCPQRSELR
jgi:hypothetical protein